MVDSQEFVAGQTSTDLLSAVMDSCRDAIIACSLEGRILSWNHAAKEIYGYQSEDAVGANLALIIPANRLNELDRLTSHAREGRALPRHVTVRERKSGEVVPVEICGFPIRRSDDRVVGFATIERDVSDRAQAADALRDTMAAAQQASAAKSRFLANVSHELRTPMNAIIGMTALALEEELSGEVRDYLETVRQSADAMQHLVNDVLDLSRFESDQFDFDMAEFDLRELVEDAVRGLGSAAHAKGLELVGHVSPDCPRTVTGDRARLRQVLTNLVGNAIKFTPSGEVVVDVAPTSVVPGRCKLKFRVIDTGIGVSAEDKSRIFSPFTQGDNGSTRRYSGTGLGLTICRHLIERFGGKLNVESAQDEGSCFWFVLGFATPNEQATRDDPGAAEDELRGLRVLVVDDNETSRQSLSEQLEAWSITASSVGSGDEALGRLDASGRDGERFDVALIDALMPGMDGFAVARRIAGNRRAQVKPILMASTTDRLEFNRRCAEAGAAAFVQKPVSQSQLHNALAQAAGVVKLPEQPRTSIFDSPPRRPLRVLLVEDTPASRKVVERALAKRGHELSIATNGREAIDAFKRRCFDVILMDVQMPIMDGLQAAKAIRAIEREGQSREDQTRQDQSRQDQLRTGVPIIAMTAHSMKGDREKCLRGGMSGYVSKPLDLTRLITVVEQSAEAGAGDRDPEPQPRPSPPGDEPRTAPSAPQACPMPPGHDSEPSRIDLTQALSRLRGDQSLLLDMIRFYREDHATLLAAIEEQRAVGELDGVERAAHSLKGLAATFDAEPVVDAARQLEEAAHDREPDLKPHVARLRIEATRLAEALAGYERDQAET